MSSDPDIRSKDQPFYLSLAQHPPTPAFHDLLQNYSKIPSNEVNSHLEAVLSYHIPHLLNKKMMLWSYHPYPTIGFFVFTGLGLCGDDLPITTPSINQEIQTTYEKILTTLKNGGKFQGTGCIFAQDVRKLVHDGILSSSLYGTDLYGEYFDYGYELSGDEDIIPKSRFITANILDENAPGLKDLRGEIEVLNAVHLIHVFSTEDKKEPC